MIRPVNIGGVNVAFPIGLAPLAGVTDRVFRDICRQMGAGMTCTEMVSAKAIVYGNKNTNEIMNTGDNEHPVAIQLFGNDEGAIAEAVHIIDDRPFDMIDFNMGCPVPKIVKNNEGSALMRSPEKVRKILTALTKASKRPVTVKMRSGFSENEINAAEIAEIAQECGVSAVIVHGRTREQMYSGDADWKIIKEVKKRLTVPVFGNGDVRDHETADRMFNETGCDGILIGRGAMGNPWVFREMRTFFENGDITDRPGREEIVAMIREHAKRLVEDKGELTGIRQMRSNAAWYTKGLRNAAEIRRCMNSIETLEGLLELFETPHQYSVP